MKKLFAKISKLVSKIHMPFTHKKMTEDECLKIMSILQDGDVVLTHTSGELSNVALAHFGHAGIFMSGRIYEATTLKVKRTHPLFFLARKDDIRVLRPKLGMKTADMFYFLEENLGLAYDFEFESDDGQFYCFELVAEAFKMGSNLSVNKVKTPIGEQYLAKTFMTNEFDIVWKK